MLPILVGITRLVKSVRSQTDQYLFEASSVCQFHCPPRAAGDRTRLHRKSLQNGNIFGHGRRLLEICLTSLANGESGDEIKRAKKRGFPAHSRVPPGAWPYAW